MKMQLCGLCIVAVALVTWCVSVPCPVAAEEVFYSYDFNDGMPDDLAIGVKSLADDPSETVAWEVSDGKMQIYDTVPTSCTVYMHPEGIFTDASLSASLESPHSSYFLSARDTTLAMGGRLNCYQCWLYHSTDTGDGIMMGIEKCVNGEQVYARNTGMLTIPGPFVMQFNVVDKETSSGVPYTTFTAELIYNNGENSRELSAHDFGLGGYDPLPYGQTVVGAFLTAGQRDAGWVMDATLDDITIRGTLVPEPTTPALLFGGILACGLFNRRGSRNSK